MWKLGESGPEPMAKRENCLTFEAIILDGVIGPPLDVLRCPQAGP